MIIAYSQKSVPIRLSQERWTHITRRHPELVDQRDSIIETITHPDLIQVGDFGERLAVRLYPATPLTRKHLVAAYRELSRDDGFVITAYFANTPSGRRKTAWKR